MLRTITINNRSQMWSVGEVISPTKLLYIMMQSRRFMQPAPLCLKSVQNPESVWSEQCHEKLQRLQRIKAGGGMQV